MNEKKYFYGTEISKAGVEAGKVDYYAFSKAFNHVLNNDIYGELECKGCYFEQVSGMIDNSEEIEALEDATTELEDAISSLCEAQNATEYSSTQRVYDDEIAELDRIRRDMYGKIEDLQNEQAGGEVFQWYIVGSEALNLLSENNEIVMYNERLDLYLWGVTHCGTSWTDVLTDIDC